MPYQLKNFDWYALKAGKKPALTLEYSGEGFREFSRFLPDIEAEGFRVLVRDVVKSPLRMNLRNRRSLSGNRSRYQIFIARRKSSIDGMLDAYEDSDISRVGRLLGYPDCCVAAHSARASNKDGGTYPYLAVENDLLAALAPEGEKYYVPGTNFLLHYDGRLLDRRVMEDPGFRRIFSALFPYSLTDHCPCSVSCRATAERGRAVFAEIAAAEPEWAARAVLLAGSPVLYLGNFSFFVLRGAVRPSGTVEYSSVIFSSSVGGVASALRSGDRVSVMGGGVEVFRAGRRIFASGRLEKMPVILPFHPWPGRAAAGPGRSARRCR